jgi:hypothetical protein
MNKIRLLACGLVIGAVAACGGGGGNDSSDGGISGDFAGRYEGSMSRVIDECNINLQWDGLYFVEQEGDALTLQVGEKYPERYGAVITSPTSFRVDVPPETGGSCTATSSYEFEDVTASSALVRWSIDYSGRCFLDQRGNRCRVVFEGVVPRS